nr:phosphomannomutase [Ipomoea batatas]
MRFYHARAISRAVNIYCISPRNIVKALGHQSWKPGKRIHVDGMALSGSTVNYSIRKGVNKTANLTAKHGPPKKHKIPRYHHRTRTSGTRQRSPHISDNCASRCGGPPWDSAWRIAFALFNRDLLTDSK